MMGEYNNDEVDKLFIAPQKYNQMSDFKEFFRCCN